jgi:hypothetical protein
MPDDVSPSDRITGYDRAVPTGMQQTGPGGMPDGTTKWITLFAAIRRHGIRFHDDS